MFYPAFLEMPKEHYETALRQCFWFINCGEENQNKKAPTLMNWEQDFKYIVSPINRVIGLEVRSVDYLHWWSFIYAYYEIGDCFFAQVVRIRDKKAHGKKLDKEEREFYRKNRDTIELKVSLNDAENEILQQWT